MLLSYFLRPTIFQQLHIRLHGIHLYSLMALAVPIYADKILILYPELSFLHINLPKRKYRIQIPHHIQTDYHLPRLMDHVAKQYVSLHLGVLHHIQESHNLVSNQPYLSSKYPYHKE